MNGLLVEQSLNLSNPHEITQTKNENSEARTRLAACAIGLRVLNDNVQKWASAHRHRILL